MFILARLIFFLISVVEPIFKSIIVDSVRMIQIRADILTNV